MSSLLPTFTVKHLFRPEKKLVRQLPVYHPLPVAKNETPEEVGETAVNEIEGLIHEERLDLGGYLVTHPSRTFIVQVHGDDYAESGISSGDLLVIDQEGEVRDGSLAVGRMGKHFIVSHIRIKNKLWFLAGTDGRDVPITKDMQVEFWGVVTYHIRRPGKYQPARAERKAKAVEKETTLTPVTEPTDLTAALAAAS